MIAAQLAQVGACHSSSSVGLAAMTDAANLDSVAVGADEEEAAVPLARDSPP